MRHGFLLIDKPRGLTSHDVVARVRRLLHERDVGHIGTLDPLATGLLVLAVGAKALKVVELFVGLSKEYHATVRFGSESSTDDADGVLTAFARLPGVEDPTDESIRACIRTNFLGQVSQVPPSHSAVHVGGERAYRKARRGEQLQLPSRSVAIERCDPVRYSYPELELLVHCSSGTYIRSLARDMGKKLSVGAHLSALRRTVVGAFRIGDAQPLDTVAWAHVVPLKDVLVVLPRVELTDAQFEEIRHGRSIACTVTPNTVAWHSGLPCALLVPTPDSVGQARPRKVF